MTRVAVVALVLLAFLAAPLATEAQPGKVIRIGVLDVGSAADSAARIESFSKALRELGHVEGQNITIEWRFAEGQSVRLSSLAAKLVGAAPDVLVSPSSAGAEALHNATTAIPIVMGGADASERLIAPENLARPRGNVTGVISTASRVAGKRMEVLREALPAVSRVGTFRDYTEIPYREGRMSKSQSERWGLTFIAIVVSGPDDFPGAFAAMVDERARALVLPDTPMLYTHRRRLAELAIKNRLAWITADREYAEAGSLMSYGADSIELIRRAATFVDRILKGAKPAELPIEQPSRFPLVINLKTAKALGLTIPPAVLARADEVIK